MKEYIRTKRLVLRDWKDEDLAPFTEMNSDPEVMKYFPSILMPEKTIEFFERIKVRIAENGYGLFAAELLETNEFAGFIGFSSPRFKAWFTPCIEIGWRLGKKFWGKGLATEGAAACLGPGFDVFGFDDIFSFTSETNAPSRRVMEKIGLSHIADFDHPDLAEGSALRKHVLYKMPKDLFLASRKLL